MELYRGVSVSLYIDELILHYSLNLRNGQITQIECWWIGQASRLTTMKRLAEGIKLGIILCTVDL